MKQLIFIHGRSQQEKDAVKLKQEWIQAWKKGLAKGGLPMPIDEAHIRFPYYGDTLAQMVGGASADDAAKIIVRGAEQNPAAEQFLSMLLQQYIDGAGITDDEIEAQLRAEALVLERGPQNWGWVQAVLRAIDRRTPGGGALIALVTNDVHQYLVNLDLRRHIEDGVLKAMDPDSENVVVSHSLGTVVAYTALRRLAAEGQAWRVPLLVTLGSPLGIRAIRGKLRPIGHPACVTRWFNAYDPNDVVSLNPLDAKNFAITPAIENKGDVDNGTDNQHGIVGYLDDAVVARRIHEALA
ncbi:MAG TPA: hypothetical protein VM619_04055 [Luteimonas sp.]|nr:hypothetical protein [Luteimonas sp.]